jgi:murein DD-endopeptidase MepM/ murein hydrolase activator NlpD
MQKRTLFLLSSILFVFSILAWSMPTQASPALQDGGAATPTPGPDGRVLYTVQTGDSLFGIAALAGITIEELRTLNNLPADETTIVPGQQLLLGYAASAEAATPTAGASILVTPVEPSPTPEGPGTASICVFLFDDVNGDAMRQETEVSISGGAISVNEQTGRASVTVNTTDELEPNCFEDLPVGNYNVTVAIPDAYNPTKSLSTSLELAAGQEVYLNFGAQINTQAVLDSPPPEEGGRSPLLGVIGVGLLLAGVGLGVYIAFSSRRGN